MLDMLAFVDTDIAHWAIFHPVPCGESKLTLDTLALTVPEKSRALFERGLMVAVNTGSDGTFAIRITSGELRDEEAKLKRESVDFPLQVTHQSLFLSTQPSAPYGGVFDMADWSEEYGTWIDIPNGVYVARVTRLGFNGEAGETWPAYVVQLFSADRLIAPPERVPRLG